MEEVDEKQRTFCVIKRDFETISLSTIITVSDLFDYSKVEERNEEQLGPIKSIHEEHSSILKGISLPEFLKTLTCYYIASSCYSKDLDAFMLRSVSEMTGIVLYDIFADFRVWVDKNIVTLVLLKDSFMYKLLREDTEINEEILTN